MPKHRSGRACPRNKSIVAPAGVPKHRSKHGCLRNRSVVAPTGVPKHQQERRSTNRSAEAPIRTSTHSFFGPRYSYDHMSFRTYNLSLSHSVFMTFFFSCSCSRSYFSLSSCFISNSCFMNISIHIAFPIFPCFIPLTYGISYTYTGILMYSHIVHVFLSLYASTFLRNWNHSNWIIQTKVMAFSYQTSQFTYFTLGTVCNTHFPVSRLHF